MSTPITQHRHSPSLGHTLLMLASCALACALAALIGIAVSPNAKEVYTSYNLPGFAPPAWIFGPVWTLMYLLMALAGWLIWHREDVSKDFLLWCAQLVLNALWSPLFFGLGLLWGSFAGIAALWVTLVYLMVQCARRGTGALFLMVPYLLWITFAGALNLAIVLLN